MLDLGAAAKELFGFLATGGWIAFAGFGTFLAYKLAFTTVISVAVVRVFHKIMKLVTDGKEPHQRLMQLIASAGMTYPLTPTEWDELIARVKPQEKRK